MSKNKELKFYEALKKITGYDSPEKLKKQAQRDYKFSYEELLEKAYKKTIETATRAINGEKRPIDKNK
jgi:hypothetical protein